MLQISETMSKKMTATTEILAVNVHSFITAAHKTINGLINGANRFTVAGVIFVPYFCSL